MRLYGSSTLLVSLAVSFVATSFAQSAVIGGAGQEYANAVTTDSAGNSYVAGLTYSPDFPITPGAYQTTFGRTCDAFVAKLDPSGKVLWATYLGGILDDSATGIALDSAGNIIVAGWTRSADFPVTNAFQKTLNNGASPGEFDGFIAKLDPTGSKLLYSTFLGGPRADMIFGLALDTAGNAYVTGTVQEAAGFPGFPTTASGLGIFVSKLDPQGAVAWSYFHPNGSASAIAVDSAGSAYIAGSLSSGALVFKLSADGKQKLFENNLSASSSADAIAVGRDGSIYIGGATNSVDFPLVHPLQRTLGARPLWKSTDAGATWLPIDDLPFAYPQSLVLDPSAPNTLYVTTSDKGLLKSTDGGGTWTRLTGGLTGTNFTPLAIDPKHPQTLYVASSSTLYKSVDGGSSWNVIDSSQQATYQQIIVDGQNSSIVYTVRGGIARKSIDGGATWSDLPFNDNQLTFLAADPAVSGNLFAFSPLVFGGGGPGGTSKNPYIWHSTDGGLHWTMIPSPFPASGSGILIDPTTTPSTVYNGIFDRSLDNGATWSPLPSRPPTSENGNTGAVALDAAGTLYANVFGNGTSNGGIYASRDRGQTWSPLGKIASPIGSQFSTNSIAAIVPTANATTLYTLVRNPQTSGFVMRLSADGTTLLFSTYLRSHISYAYDAQFVAEPPANTGENVVTALALNPAGDIVVAGQTRGNDFPTANPAQSTNAGRGDAFIATIAADGSKLLFGTYIGGSRDDAALGLSTDAQGNITIAGQTLSVDFPGGVKPPAGQIGDAFVVRLAAPGPPVITAVQNAASNQPGIESGSWVAIKGTHLANTDPGRIWKDEEVVNGNMPTSLDGVSVTINGKPAFVYYISPTQINVQAPTDTATGPVDVVVNNNGAVSAAFTVRLQGVAPAFFTYLGTNTAIASRLPDYSQTVRPGDTIVLWATGFGPTSPSARAGVAVTGAPAVVTAPTVTIGGVQVPVVSAVLTTGTAGLYQITVQLPAGIPTGAQAVQATVGTVKTPVGVTITIGQ